MRFLTRIFLLLLVAIPSAKASSAPTPGIFTLVAENDVLAGTDRHFTQGTRVSYYSGEDRSNWLTDTAELIPYFRKRGPGRESWRANLAFGQSIYTPSDITAERLQKTERPYAAYLYAGLGLLRISKDANNKPKTLDTFELQLGVVGPYALGEEVQSGWHEHISDSPEPKGWRHQLKNEPIVNLHWDRQWRKALNPLGGLEMDLMPHAGLSLGNLDTHAGVGFTLRLGLGLWKDNGPSRIRPSLPGSGYLKASDRASGYFFIGTESRLIGRNIFLDGNTFTDSHRVAKKPLVVDTQYGISMAYMGAKITLTNIIRGQEYKGQQDMDQFTALSIAWKF